MSTETVLFALRVITALLLIGWMGTVFAVLWRDYRAVCGTMAGEHRRRGRLVVIHSESRQVPAGTTYPLLPLNSLGRGPTNTVRLEDTFCSQEHALLTWRGGQWWLEDRASSNGTLLNGEPVREPVVVSSGDLIGIGQVQLKVELE